MSTLDLIKRIVTRGVISPSDPDQVPPEGSPLLPIDRVYPEFIYLGREEYSDILKAPTTLGIFAHTPEGTFTLDNIEIVQVDSRSHLTVGWGPKII